MKKQIMLIAVLSCKVTEFILNNPILRVYDINIRNCFRPLSLAGH